MFELYRESKNTKKGLKTKRIQFIVRILKIIMINLLHWMIKWSYNECN
jgi:hypothetical protein